MSYTDQAILWFLILGLLGLTIGVSARYILEKRPDGNKR